MVDVLWARAGEAAQMAEALSEKGRLGPHDGTLAAFAARDLRMAASDPPAAWSADGVAAALRMADILEALWQFGVSGGRVPAGGDSGGAARDEVDLRDLARAGADLIAAMPQAWSPGGPVREGEGAGGRP